MVNKNYNVKKVLKGIGWELTKTEVIVTQKYESF
jgi:ABC-type polar amino acid transport system ATPase subunit